MSTALRTSRIIFGVRRVVRLMHRMNNSLMICGLSRGRCAQEIKTQIEQGWKQSAQQMLSFKAVAVRAGWHVIPMSKSVNGKFPLRTIPVDLRKERIRFAVS